MLLCYFRKLIVSGVWNRRGNVNFTLESGARYELVEGDIRRAFSKYGKVKYVKLYPRAKRGLDGHVGKERKLNIICSSSNNFIPCV